MAPPSIRRPGFSRRAHYGLFLGYVVAVGGVLFALLLLVIAAVDPRGFNALKGAALDATSPVSNGGRAVVNSVTGVGTSISDYFRAGTQNAQLRAELAAARRELVQTQAARLENERLKQVLGIAGRVTDDVTTARITGSTIDSSRRLATLSAGSSAGVQIGMPVRGPDGLIGRVLETGRWASRVLLITDGASTVPVRLVRDGTPALAVGRGDGFVELKTLEVGANPFRVGDVLITSGVGGIFPPDVPVARVAQLQGDVAIARPIADPARIDIAVVQRAFQPAAGAPLDQGPPQAIAPPVTAVPPGLLPARQAVTPPQVQRDPRYQPALTQPQATARPAAPPVAPPNPAQNAAGPRPATPNPAPPPTGQPPR